MGGAPVQAPPRTASSTPIPRGSSTPTPKASSLDDLYRDASTISGGTPPPTIDRGTIIANGRYEITNLLGQGAMGAVYKAKDLELDRWVAIKVIQPELVSSPAILKRFKQELILARQVTHRNVVRIFDIGETEGMKFITMEYVDGGDLKSLIIENGKMSAEQVVGIIRQICYALEAAHGEGVVHRDLKPQNIMMDQTGRVVVMDFGIAHSKELPGMTMTGALMGTPEYMSPEQAKGEKTDLRADIFAVGIIFYEMLIGKVPFKSNTVVETMYKRTTERAVSPIDLDSSIPVQANQIVMKCLETDPANRYQDVKELLKDLEVFDPEKKISSVDRVRRSVKRRSKALVISAAVIVIVAVAVIAGFLLRSRFLQEAAPVAHAPVTVLIADFSNHTEDPVFDGTLEPVVKLALEGAGFITAFERTAVVRTLGVPVSDKLDETAARQLAVAQGLGVVMSGSLDRQGKGYSLSVKATRAVTGEVVQNSEETTTKKDQVVFTTTKLAAAVRKALGDDTSESVQRFAMETLTATSLEAIHDYATAMTALADGKHDVALQNFSKAVEIDSNFGLAYAGMAIASRNLGQEQDSEKYIKQALGHMDRMTERERYRTRGSYYAILSDDAKCVEEYGALIGRFPADAAAHNNRAVCWTGLRNMSKGIEEMRQAAAILPKKTTYRNNIALYLSYASDFPAGEREARSALELDPSYANNLIALAFAQLGQGQLKEAAETYQRLAKISKQGESIAKTGLADLALYEGRFSDAARILEQGAPEDLAAKYPDRAAAKFAMLAFSRLSQGQKGPAITAAESALASSKTVKTRFSAGRAFIAAGQANRAKELAAGLASELQNEPQAYAKLLEGESMLAGGDPRKAIPIFKEANSLLDTWIGRFDLGKAYLEAGAFPEADSEFDQCIRRRGEALSLFLDQLPTYGYLPTVYYYMGRVREGLKSAGFRESYRTFLSMREKAGEDPLLADVRKRVQQ